MLKRRRRRRGQISNLIYFRTLEQKSKLNLKHTEIIIKIRAEIYKIENKKQ